MQKQLWICDHCGKEINDNSGWIDRDVVLPLIEWSGIDLCDNCMRVMCRDVETFLKNAIPSYRDAENFNYKESDNE